MEADYIVVGTGSAGSVMANRLSADQHTVRRGARGGPAGQDKFIHIPAGFSKLMRSEVDWDYLTEPQKELDGREIYWPRGKMLGGSSSMNAMMWVRGFAADYDEWAERPASNGTTPMSSRTSTHRGRSTCRSHGSAARVRPRLRG